MRAAVLMMVWLASWMLPSMLRAAVMEISFSGEIYAVENKVGDYWEGDADSLVGTPVQGRYWLDATAAGEGRQETSFYWWWDIDNRSGVMTSEISVGGRQIDLTGDHDCFDIMGNNECQAGEFIDLYTDDLDDGELETADSLHLKDQDQVTVVLDLDGGVATYAESSEILEINFGDIINDILGPPPLDHAFHWIDTGAGQGGSGLLRLQGWDVSDTGPFPELWDTNIRFSLKEVISKPAGGTGPIDVPEPASLVLLLLGWLTAIWLRHRKSDG
ncbi:MAG TPA: PEP-CTERM sorting domain-containing protein [Dongiaceae bacterium]|nr:PEP-CTERM sorting domain-containing protein [Dongiaceae bacterium]